jgi:putative ABC transport system permease protein
LIEWYDRVLHADLIVSSTGRVVSYEAQPLHESLGKELEMIPGVRKGPQRGAYGIRFIHTVYENQQIAIKANDEPDAYLNYSTLDVVDRPVAEAGYELYRSQDPVLMVSENFVLHFNKKTGDRLNLETPSGLVTFRIVGVMRDFASDVGVFYLNRDTYKRLWNDPLVNGFGLQLKAGADPEKVRQEINRKLGQSKSLMVTSNSELREQMVQIIDQTFATTHAVEVAALLVGLLGLLNTLFISVMERMKEIGMLRAVGMSRSQVSQMILQEALFQGGLGALAAVALGGWLAFLWITYSLSHVLGWIVQFHFPWVSVFTTVLIGLVVALLAGFFPARKAADLEITEALDYD